eukprot:8372070-Pyramimonas_sp.AAC.1
MPLVLPAIPHPLVLLPILLVLSSYCSSSSLHAQVEVIHDLCDWGLYFTGAKVSVAGLAIAIEGESANHSFRFAQRADLAIYK